MRAGQTLLQAESVCLMDDSLIHIDLYRNVRLIAKVLEYEISWPSHEEQIRDCLSIPCGFTNDQFVLTVASFFRRNSLAPGTTALGDGGFYGNDEFNMDTMEETAS